MHTYYFVIKTKTQYKIRLLCGSSNCREGT